ncbi:MAG TPA: MauE/DoxX family redox-associated membrane protein [Bryobacteraceae bacterium]|nr:MauE/DoxX family redox-associated membrane protein [Bryobacteraceae bacterium]
MATNHTAALTSFEQPAWKSIFGTIAAVIMGVIFFAAGAWKLTEPFTWAQALGQFRVPSPLDMPLTLLIGIGDTLAAVLIVVPAFRRWGSILMSVELIVYMAYIGINYGALAGKDCSCFPLVKRSVGPMFFVSDGLMLLLAILAGVWARRSSGIRGALAALGAVLVFAGISYGINAKEHSGIHAPSPITVDGKPYSLDQGHIFVFFYDPECMHCDAAARRMATYKWKDTTVVAVPTRVPQFAAAFLHDTGLKAVTSLDVDKLRQVFKFINAPYGVALDNGREIAAVDNFDESEPARTLRSIGYVQ